MTNQTEQRPSEPLWPVLTSYTPAIRALTAFRCRLRRNAIDMELAAGADPNSSECHHRRGSELTAESNRQALAAAFERHLAAATSFPPLEVLPVNWHGVRAATPRLERLVKRLREDPRVRVQGVARARLLLTDADSALYAKDDDSRLAHEVRSTLAVL
jgi:hypothetical protein